MGDFFVCTTAKLRRKVLARKVTRIAKLEFIGGQAKPGPELASLGINMPQFCVKFNDQSSDRKGEVVPVVITAYTDKSFDIELKTTPVALLLKKAAGVEKGSAEAHKTVVGEVTMKQVEEIANYKMPDLNTNKLESAVRIVLGTARNMGIKLKDAQSTETKTTEGAENDKA